MKKLMSIVFGLSLLVPAWSIAQDTGGCKGMKAAEGKKATKTQARVEKGHKGGKKGKKVTTDKMTTKPASK